MKNTKRAIVIEVHNGELTPEGRCSACNREVAPSKGKGKVGSTKSFRNGYDNINWGEVSETIRNAQGKAAKAYLN